MVRKDRQADFYKLRHQHKYFTFEEFKLDISERQLSCTYHFSMDGNVAFRPQLIIPYRTFYKNWPGAGGDTALLSLLFFHVGMVELVSYWKAACPPLLVIKPYALDARQVDWWKNLYYHGLGEFFYLNGLDPDPSTFKSIMSEGKEIHPPTPLLDEGYLVPVGGGKDSVVSLELLKSTGPVRPLLLNPRGAMLNTLHAAGMSREESVELQRTLDPGILRLNEVGYLNGHTPFSALLAFQSLIGAYLCGSRNIALSNEGSANESTIPGTHINHQYSKSFDFESGFRDYVSRYISPAFNYFSFLRPLKELQIASLFSRYPAHHHSFRSCNAGSKTDTWCCACPKCLFAWVILSPFLGEDKLNDIFGHRLLDDPAMMFYLQQLSGHTEEKPFECIGTIDEVRLALYLIREMNPGHVPGLVAEMDSAGQIPDYSREAVCAFFETTDPQHFLSSPEITLLKKNLACPGY